MSLVAENIKKLRIDADWSQDVLAEKVFTTKSTISKWESGAQVPSLDSLRLLASVFRIPIYQIIGERPQSIRDKTWALLGKGVFWAVIWVNLDVCFGLLMLLGSVLSISLGLGIPIIKPVTVIVIDAIQYRIDGIEVMKIIGFFLASPLLGLIFIVFGIGLFHVFRIYMKFSTKVFWNTNVKLLDHRFRAPRLPKWVWAAFAIAAVIGLILIITSIGLVAHEGTWSRRMW